MAVDEKRLVRAVAERTWLSTEESADITRAVVQGLAGQLSEGEARRLAGDLPESLADQLPVERRRRQGAHPVDVATFISELSTSSASCLRTTRAWPTQRADRQAAQRSGEPVCGTGAPQTAVPRRLLTQAMMTLIPSAPAGTRVTRAGSW